LPFLIFFGVNDLSLPTGEYLVSQSRNLRDFSFFHFVRKVSKELIGAAKVRGESRMDKGFCRYFLPQYFFQLAYVVYPFTLFINVEKQKSHPQLQMA
jgi:hypothetical protein